MRFDPQKHHRRSIRLKEYDYTQPGGYFVTIVTYQREYLFGELTNEELQLSKYGLIAKQQWEKLPKRFPNIELGAFVVMPNHVHGIIQIVDETRSGTAENRNDLYDIRTRRAPTQEQFQKRWQAPFLRSFAHTNPRSHIERISYVTTMAFLSGKEIITNT